VFQLDLFELEESEIVDRVMKKSTLEYIKPAKMYDCLDIWCRTAKLGDTSMIMNFIITRGEEQELVLKAEIIYVAYNPKKEAIKPLPEILRQSIERFENGI
jgi:acyl-CoA thioester hydrolase